MDLKRVFIERSPSVANRVRLCGEVAYTDWSIRTEVYWFEVSEKYAEYLSQSGNPWLACLLPLALTVGEPLRISRPIDRVLFENVQELIRIWKCWYPHLHSVAIEAEGFNAAGQSKPPKTGAFFSGGVDSFFTILRNDDGSESFKKNPVDELLCVWGFDVPLQNAEAFKRMRNVLSRAASDLGKELIDIATNLRDTAWGRTDWGRLSHGCALASVALALEPRYRQVMVASSDDYRELSPWGSHVLTDPLLSTGTLKIIHDGAGYSRLEKTERVAKSDVALRSLRVCWRSRSDVNCGTCEKCLRTILTLELIGALDRCAAFSGARVNVAYVKRVYIAEANLHLYYQDIRAFAVQKGRKDIAKAIDQCVKGSTRLTRWLGVVRSMATKRVLWRFAEPLQRAMLARYVS